MKLGAGPTLRHHTRTRGALDGWWGDEEARVLQRVEGSGGEKRALAERVNVNGVGSVSWSTDA